MRRTVYRNHDHLSYSAIVSFTEYYHLNNSEDVPFIKSSLMFVSSRQCSVANQNECSKRVDSLAEETYILIGSCELLKLHETLSNDIMTVTATN